MTFSAYNSAYDVSNDVHFDIMDAFSRLDTNKKMVLFDHLMGNNPYAYRNVLHDFWPKSTESDARKLEIILKHRIQRLQSAA